MELASTHVAYESATLRTRQRVRLLALVLVFSEDSSTGYNACPIADAIDLEGSVDAL
jgi:hypothetical protein